MNFKLRSLIKIIASLTLISYFAEVSKYYRPFSDITYLIFSLDTLCSRSLLVPIRINGLILNDLINFIHGIKKSNDLSLFKSKNSKNPSPDFKYTLEYVLMLVRSFPPTSQT